jgi:hypothetical protein
VADYYTREVVTEPVNLTKEMQQVLTLRGAEVSVTGKGCVLESMVTGNLTDECVVSFEEGWNDNDPEELIEWHEPEIADADKPEFVRLLALDKHEFFREVLKVDTEADHITLQSSWSCSKMRLDGFGGSGLIVNREGFLYITTCDYTIDDDGVISPRSIFSPWEELDEQAAAAVEGKEEVLSEDSDQTTILDHIARRL